MSNEPQLFGFGGPEKPVPESPIEFISHHMIGANFDDLEYGCWNTEEKAFINFAKQFSELSQQAEGLFLFVRCAPICKKEVISDFGIDWYKWRVIGRFSIAKLKEKNT
jgi:hypothetical protein